MKPVIRLWLTATAVLLLGGCSNACRILDPATVNRQIEVASGVQLSREYVTKKTAYLGPLYRRCDDLQLRYISFSVYDRNDPAVAAGTRLQLTGWVYINAHPTSRLFAPSFEIMDGDLKGETGYIYATGALVKGIDLREPGLARGSSPEVWSIQMPDPEYFEPES